MNLKTTFMNALTGPDFDDKHDESVKPAIEALTSYLENEKYHLIDAALAAFLPHSNKKHALLEKAFTEIETHWAYVKKKFTDEPVWLDRYVLGQALLALADKDKQAAARMYLALKDPFAYQSHAQEEQFQVALLQAWQPMFHSVSSQYWEPENAFNPTSAKILQVELSPEAVKELKKELKDGAGTVSFTDSAGNPVQWGSAFAESAANAVTAAINSGLHDLTVKLPNQMRSATAYHDTIADILRNATRIERQGQLLWWLQSRYSVPSQQSYRTLEPLNGALQMTTDFARFAPTLVPEEVDAILLEALWTTYPNSVTETRPLNDWVDDVLTLKEAASIGNSAQQDAPLLLCDVIALKRAGTKMAAAELVGVSTDVQLSLAEFTLWLWHSTQVRYV